MNWSTRRIQAFVVACIGGALLAVAFGYPGPRYSPFTYWLTTYPTEPLVWAIVGAAIAGSAVFVFLALSKD